MTTDLWLMLLIASLVVVGMLSWWHGYWCGGRDEARRYLDQIRNLR